MPKTDLFRSPCYSKIRSSPSPPGPSSPPKGLLPTTWRGRSASTPKWLSDLMPKAFRADVMPSAQSPKMIGLAGACEGQIFEVGAQALTIGRQAANRVQLYHESVSRRHCLLEPTTDGVRLQDLESLCGTFVNVFRCAGSCSSTAT